MKPLFAILAVFIVSSIAYPDQIVRDGVISTSLVRVLAKPESYAGKRILLKGYLKIDFEESGLYLSEDDGRILNTQQALWIGSPKGDRKIEYPKRGFVMIVGTLEFDARQHGYGHMGGWIAELKDIEQILPLKK